ncbi:hypothetical protein Rhopal_005994-T1 [Rhodotorula paludigena]|uniref:Uncharacterized protein n=1 Tax=Rhodotorula paludigena TaxID=86838 RepID=A0AAV5GSQ6_9BASI|nr:hypothetical protein Rhopal_005994-T1 [Rhodotorula paludigena]
MAYNNPYYGHAPPGAGDYTEHLADQPRFSGDMYSAQPYSGLPYHDDPEMAELGNQRPLSGSAGSEAGSASAYWAPGRHSTAGAGGMGVGAGAYHDEFDDLDGGQDSFWRRKRWLVIAAVLGAVAILAVALGVGLGVGLNQNNGNSNDAAQLSDSRSSSSTAPGGSVSVGYTTFTSLSYVSGSESSVVSTASSTESLDHDIVVVFVQLFLFLLLVVVLLQLQLDERFELEQYNYYELKHHIIIVESNDASVVYQCVSSSLSCHTAISQNFSHAAATPADSTTTAPPAATSPPLSTDENGGTYTFTTRPIINPGGFTIGTLTGYVTISSS